MAGDNRKQPGHSWRANALAWTQAVRESRIESRRLATELAIVEAVLARQPVRVLDRSAENPGFGPRAILWFSIPATGNPVVVPPAFGAMA